MNPQQAHPPAYPGAAAPCPYPQYPGAPGYPTNNPGYPGYPPQGPMSMPQPGYPSSTPYPPTRSPYPPASYPQGVPGAPPTYPQAATGAPPSYPQMTHAAPPPYPQAPGYGQPPQQPGYGSVPPVHDYQQRSDYSQNQSATPAQQVPVQAAPRANPTVRPFQGFDPRADAEALRKAMKGFGTDEKTIIQILTRRTNSQRQEILTQYRALYGKDLIHDLKKELNGNFENLVLALMTPTDVFLARELHHAMQGAGTNEETLIEILATSTNNDIRSLKMAYEREFGRSLESDVKSDTDGNFERLLVSLCQGLRDENPIADPNSAERDAQALLAAGKLRMGTDESTFNAILCTRSYAQLKQIFLTYQSLSGQEFEQAIKSEFSGSIEEGLLAIVGAVKDRPLYFAKCLHDCLARMGTNDRRLIRILTTRCEVDMGDIKDAYRRKYGRTLEEDISNDTSGDYKKTFLALLCG